MEWNFLTGSQKHRTAMRADEAIEWDLELVTHIFGLAAIAKSEHKFYDPEHKVDSMNIRVLIDNIEVDPSIGFSRLLGVIKSCEEETEKQKKFKYDLQRFIADWEDTNT
ncbi:hypothetical protein [Paenibacillus sp. 1781tsa1]|uniref:hypothetical protein n=1 Tax=Paenibacillus sp. 1781tsa1 TaxID=2953810 RepID=UPI00209ED5A9|nr:hypothetical protein [Paenibacillus sp. 1781tsa1]MCP1185051.1 hypothetical protein [Paenibacillus sp. 1781tsa1]